MELSSPSNPEVDSSVQPSRRKSGRVSRKPDVLTPSFTAKRKRIENVEAQDDNSDVGMDEDASSGEEQGETDGPDEEESRQIRRAKRFKSNIKRSNAASKKTRIDGDASGLAIRQRQAQPKKARKLPKARIANAQEAGGLYGTSKSFVYDIVDL